MSHAVTVLRRSMLLTLVVIAVAVLVARRRRSDAIPAQPPQWPPFTAAATPAPAAADQDEPAVAVPWVTPPLDGSAPDGYPVKAKQSSHIFHVPGGRFYDRTTADRWYVTAEAAEADGYRRSKN